MDPEEFISLVVRLRELGVAKFKFDTFEVDFRNEAWQPQPALPSYFSTEQIEEMRDKESRGSFEDLAFHSS